MGIYFIAYPYLLAMLELVSATDIIMTEKLKEITDNHVDEHYDEIMDEERE